MLFALEDALLAVESFTPTTTLNPSFKSPWVATKIRQGQSEAP